MLFRPRLLHIVEIETVDKSSTRHSDQEYQITPQQSGQIEEVQLNPALCRGTLSLKQHAMLSACHLLNEQYFIILYNKTTPANSSVYLPAIHLVNQAEILNYHI